MHYLGKKIAQAAFVPPSDLGAKSRPKSANKIASNQDTTTSGPPMRRITYACTEQSIRDSKAD